MMRRTKWLLGAGALFAVAAVGVNVVGDPLLIRYPTNIDETMQYTGTATVYVNPSTGARLATPLQTPLTVNRHIKVVSHDFSHAVVQETDAISFAGTTQTTSYQYYMNRRTMQMVDGPKSYAFGNPDNVMSTDGSYRINFPVGTRASRSYRAWAPETNSAITVTSTGPAHRDLVSGEQVVTFNTSLDHAVAPYYVSFLQRLGMPTSLPASSVAAQLQAAGADLGRVMSDVAPKLTAAEVATLTGALAQPVPLRYSYFQQGQVSVEPTTGAVVNADVAKEGVAVTPDMTGAAPAVAILAPYANLPSVRALSRAVTTLSQTQVSLQMQYREMPASVLNADAKAHNLANQISLIQWKAPVGLGAVALVVLLLAAVWRPRPQPGGTARHALLRTGRRPGASANEPESTTGRKAA